MGIQIAMIKHADVPYPIFCLDGWFSNFLGRCKHFIVRYRVFIVSFYGKGFMVSFIYFTDPSVITVVQEIWTRIKQRYVDEYYSVNISRSKTTSGFAHHHPPPPPPPPRHSPPTKQQRPSASTTSIQSPTGSNQSIRSFSADDAFLTMRYAQQDMQDTTASPSPPHQAIVDSSAPVMASELKILEKYYRNRLQGDEKGQPSHQQIPYLRRFTYPNATSTQRRHRLGKIYKVVEIADDIQLRELPSTSSQQQQQQQQQTHEQHEAATISGKCLPCLILKAREQNIGDADERQQRHGVHCYLRGLKKQWKDMGQPRRLPMHRIRTADILHGSSLSPEDRSEIWRMNTSAAGTVDEDQLDTHLSHVSTTSGPSGWSEVKSSGYVEPYDHPQAAKLIHWLLVTVCRVKPRDRQDHIVELIELFPVKDGEMSLAEAAAQQGRQNRASIRSSLSPEISDQSLPRSMKADTSAKRSSYLSQSSGGTSNSSKASTTTSSLSEPHRMVTRSSKLKGKEPARGRPKKHPLWHDNEREPHISNAELKPGKDMQRRSVEDGNHFLFTVTDDNGSQEHHEYLSALRESGEHLSPPQRPGLLRRISGKTSPGGKKESPSSFFSMLSNGSLKDKHPQRMPGESAETILSLATPKPAKPISPSVFETHRSSPETDISSAAPSPTSNISNRKYPHSLRARPKEQYSHKSWIPPQSTARSVERDGVALRRVPSTLVQDFLNKHRLLVDSEATYRRSAARANHAAAMQFISTIGAGFSQGVTKAVYISNWEHDNANRIKICKESWSFEELATKLMEPDM